MIAALVIATLFGISTNNVILINHTGLKVVRIEIGDKKIEEINDKLEQIVVNVTPEKHNLIVVFKGGGRMNWPNFDFHGIHQITFERIGNRIRAMFE